MPYLVPGDPNPRKTPAELAAEETPRDELDAEIERHRWGVWSFAAIGAALLVGAVVRWCNL